MKPKRGEFKRGIGKSRIIIGDLNISALGRMFLSFQKSQEHLPFNMKRKANFVLLYYDYHDHF